MHTCGTKVNRHVSIQWQHEIIASSQQLDSLCKAFSSKPEGPQWRECETQQNRRDRNFLNLKRQNELRHWAMNWEGSDHEAEMESCVARTYPQVQQTNVYCTLHSLEQPFSIFLPWRNPWSNFQVSGNPCIKIIISTAHGTLAWSVSCRYNNTIIIVNALLSREWYFFCGSVYFGQQVQKTMFIFF
jgi:hypothetical protein